MAKDMHKEEWDSATLTKLEVFEQYIHDWLNVTLNYGRDKKNFETLEIYDLFCGSGFDGTKTHKGSPLRILDVLRKRDLKGANVKVLFNDNDKKKISELKKCIEQKYRDLKSKNVDVKFSSVNTQEYAINSKNYYKLIFLDQYGIQHVVKINEFLKGGRDILMFISSGHIRRFMEESSFEKFLDSKNISKSDFEGKSSYETHRVVAEYFKRQFNDSHIAHFSLIKDNANVNGLIFISTHRKGQEQFLKTAWEIDKDFGEGNINIDRDIYRDKKGLFYNEDIPTQKEEEYKNLLLEFLKDKKSNIEIKDFGLDNGFLTKHTKKILKEVKDNLDYEYCDDAKTGFHLDDKKEKVYIKFKQ